MKTKLVVTSLLCMALFGASVHASTLYWSGNGTALGGAGSWDTTAAHWGTSTSGPFTTVWNNANTDDAQILHAAGATDNHVITLSQNVTMNGTLTWQQTPGTYASYSIAGATSTLTFSPGSQISCNNSAGGSLGVGLFNTKYAGTITFVGPAQLEFNNANGTVTKFIFNAGTASFASFNRFGLGADAADFLTFNGGSMRPNTTTAWTMGKSITVNSGGGTISGSSAAITITQNKPITWNNGNLTINIHPLILTSTTSSGSGTLTLANGVATTCNAAGVIPSGVVLNITTSGSTFTMNGFNQTVKAVSGTAGTVSVGAAQLTLDNPSGQSYSSVFSGTGKVIKNGAGAQSLSGSSTGWTGEWVINNGTIGVGGANIFGSTGGTLTISGGKLANTSGTGRTIPAPVSVNITADFTVDDSLFTSAANGQILLNGPTTLKNGTRTITVQGTSTTTPNLGLAGVVGEDAAGRGIIKNGLNGTLALNAVNNYSGDTTINAGTININATSTLGNGAGTLHLSGGKLQITASRTSTVPNPIDVTADSVIATSSAAATVDCDFTTSAITATAGTTLTFRNDATSGTGVWQPRFSSGGFTYNEKIAIVNGSFGTTKLQSYNTTGTDQTFNGIISGTGSYNRTASVAGTGGRTIFTAANTYSGGTTVNRGTLLVNNTTGSGTGSGTVTVASDGTLGGTGEIAGATTVSGTLSPGASIGTLTFDSTLGLSGTTRMEINRTAAPNADKIVMNGGTVTLGGNLTVVDLGGGLTLGDTFDLIDGTIANSFTTFTLPALAPGLGWNASQLSPGGNGTITVVTLTADAGPNQTICSGTGVPIGGSPTASGGSGGGYTYLWTPATGLSSATAANPIASPASTTTYSVTVTDGLGSTSLPASVTVTVDAAATVSAGPNQTVCYDSPTVTLAGSIGGAASSATWSGGAGTFVPDNTTLNATYTPTAGEITAGTVTLTLTTDDPPGVCGPVSSSMTITINAAPAITVQPTNLTVCASSPAIFWVGATGAGLTYQWQLSGDGGTTFTNISDTATNASYTNLVAALTDSGNQYQVIVSGACNPAVTSAPPAALTVNAPATVNAGPNQTVCASSPATVLAGSFGGGATSATWSGAGTFAPDNTTMNATYTPTPAEIAAGSATVTLTTDDPAGPCPAVSASMTITINPVATVNAGPNQTVCASSPATVLAGSFGGAAGSATWSGAGTFAPNNTTMNATYTPTPAEIAAGSATVTLTTDDPAGPCGAVNASMTITINPVATVNAGPNQTVCASSPATVLAGSIGGAASSATWSGAGTFTPNATTLNATYTPTPAEIAAGSATVTLTTDDPAGPCGAVNASMTITINPVATVNAGPNQTVCASSPAAILAGSFGGAASSATWSGAGTFTPNASTLNATYTPTPAEITAGSATVTLTTDDPAGPCGAVSASMTITINPAATVNAGPNQTVCASSPAVTLAGSFGGAATSATWSGAGTFTPNNTTMNATYTPTPAEITAGSATVTLTTDDPAGPCPAVSASMTITIRAAPTASAGADKTACSGSPVAIGGSPTASGGTGPYTYSWSPATGLSDATVANPTATVTSTTTYTVTVTDANGCTASDSMDVIVIPTPVIESITQSGTDITLVWSTLAGQTYRVEYKDNLTDVSWTALTPDVTAAGATATKTDLAPASPQRFYRISVVCP